MQSVIDIQYQEAPCSLWRDTIVTLTATRDIIIVGQLICRFTRDTENPLERMATLSILSSIYGAIKQRFEWVFLPETASLQYALYPHDSRELVLSEGKIEWIWQALISNLIELLRKENVTVVRVQAVEQLISYYESIWAKLVDKKQILATNRWRWGVYYHLRPHILLPV